MNCQMCNNKIPESTPEHLKKEYYQEEYPDITIGPFCSDCFPKVKICIVCQTPNTENVKLGSGKYCCKSCMTLNGSVSSFSTQPILPYQPSSDRLIWVAL